MSIFRSLVSTGGLVLSFMTAPALLAAAPAAAPSAETARATCEAGIRQLLGGSDMHFVDANGEALHGFDVARGSGVSAKTLVSFIGATASEAYFYTEMCDICGDLLRCDLKTGVAHVFKSGHVLDCSDLPALPPTANVDIECRRR